MCIKQIFLILGIACALDAQAFSLVESYALAVQKDPKLKAATLTLDATRYELDKAKAGYLPRVQMSLSRGRGSTESDTGNALTSSQRTYETKNYGITLRQPLLNMTLAPDKQKAEDNIQISEIQLHAEGMGLFSRVSEKYFNVLHAADILRNQHQKQNSLEKQRIQAEKRYRAGVGVKNDMTDLDAEIALVKAQVMEAELQLAVANAQFEVVTGVMPNRLLALDYAQLKESQFDQRSLEDWLNAARLHNPTLLQAEKEVDVYTHEYQKDRAMHYPTLDFLLSRSRTESDNNITIGTKFDTLSGMVQLNMPIYMGGYTSATAAQSAVQIEAAKSHQDSKYQELVMKISSEYSSLKNARHLMEAYDHAIRAYEDSLTGAIKAQAAGTRTLADVLKMRDRLTETRLNLSKTCYQYILSFIHLRELAGEIDQDDFVGVDRLLKEPYFAEDGDGVAALGMEE